MDSTAPPAPAPRTSDGMVRKVLRLVLAVLYFVAGVLHLLKPHPFLQITPGWVPYPEAVIYLTGVAELLGAVGLLQPFSPPLRRAAAIGLALYAVCVFPANINHFVIDMGRPDHGLGLAYHVPRMFAQPLLVWLALWCGGVTGWPFARKPA